MAVRAAKGYTMSVVCSIQDIDTIKRRLSELMEKQDIHFQGQQGDLWELNGILASSKPTPKWLLALFCIASAVTVLTLGYFEYHFIKLEDFKIEAFNNGKAQVILDLRGYFDEDPNVYQGLEAWSKAQKSVPNKK